MFGVFVNSTVYLVETDSNIMTCNHNKLKKS